MPGLLVHLGALVQCMHAAPASPTSPNPRVMVSGQPVVTLGAPWTIAGCPFTPPSGNGPCATAQFVTSATRVLAGGQPLLLSDSQATCVPTGTGVLILSTQTRVRGQ